MTGTIVTFQYLGAFDAAKLRKIAEMARPRFESMPGLRSKVFTLNPKAHQVVNVYVWDSEEAARTFFNEELLQRVTALYGMRPSIAFVEIAALVDNAASGKIEGGSSPNHLEERSASSVRERTPSFE
jgi:heme-degrading monooxygenase HmoA